MSKTQTTKRTTLDIEKAIVSNLSRMQTEHQRLLFRLQRARAMALKLRNEIDFSDHSLDDREERLLDQYEAFISDLEIYVEHYEYEIQKVKKGLFEATSLRESHAKLSFMTYIVEDTTRTVANLRIANSEYQEILAILPVDGLE